MSHFQLLATRISVNTVLLADSEPFQRLLVREILSAEPSIAVVEIGDGKAAYALATRQHPDLMILDMLLPRLDGLSLCRLIRAESSLQHTRLMILTALKNEMGPPETLWDAFLTRPCDDALLLETVCRLLNITHP